MLLLTYDQIVSFLKNKYGEVLGHYFLDQECHKRNPHITRSKEGLEIHHIYEYIYRGLSNPYNIQHLPFKYQKAENLVYCNLLEHFLLHLKICDYSKNPQHPNVGKRGAEIIFQRLFKIYALNYYSQKQYERKLAQKIYYLKSDYYKLTRFFQSLQLYL